MRTYGNLFGSPSCLTYNDETGTKDQGDDSWDFDAAISLSVFSGFQNNLISTLKRPTTILELRSDCILTHKPAHIFDFDSSPCAVIRKFLFQNPCSLQDERVANCFRGQDKTLSYFDISKLKKALSSCNGSCSDSCSLCSETSCFGNIARPKIEIINMDDNTAVSCASYICPMTGYVELAFPIIIYSKTLAVLFVGRVRTIESIRLERELRNDYFIKHCSFLRVKKDATRFKEMFLDRKIDAKLEHDYLDITSYNMLLRNIALEIRKFESMVMSATIEYRINYIQDVIRRESEQFFTNHLMQTKPVDVRSSLKSFWNGIDESIDKLKQDLFLNEIVVFGSNDIHPRENEGKLNVVVPSNDVKYAKTTLQIGKISGEISSFNEREYERLLFNCIDFEESIKSKYSEDNSIMLFSKYGRSIIMLLSVKADAFSEQLSMALREIIKPLFYFISTALTVYTKTFALHNLSIYKHESDYYRLFLESIIEKAKNTSFLTSSKKNSQKVMQDLIKAYTMINQLAVTVPSKGFFESAQNSDEKSVVICTSFFEEWCAVLEPIRVSKFLSCHIKCLRSYTVLIPNSIIGRILLPVLHNAFKYSHECTNITIDCIPDYKSEKLEIMVVDYGIEIDSFSNNCMLGIRGNNVLNIPGTGYGLCISNYLATEYNIEISFSCELISSNEKAFICKEEYEKLSRKNNELIKNSSYNDIIDKLTYKVVFILKIPIKF